MEDQPEIWQVFERSSSIITLQEIIFDGSAFVQGDVIDDDQACGLVDYTFDFAGVVGDGCEPGSDSTLSPTTYDDLGLSDDTRDLIEKCPETAKYFPFDQIPDLLDMKDLPHGKDYFSLPWSPSGSLSGNPAEITSLGIKDDSACMIIFVQYVDKIPKDTSESLDVAYMEMDSVEKAQQIGIKFVSDRFYNFRDTKFDKSFVEKVSNIGDEGWLYKSSFTSNTFYTLVARKGRMLFSVTYGFSRTGSNRKTAETLLLAAIAGKPKTGPFNISKVTPDTVSAGIAKLDNETGVVSFDNNKLILKIEGSNLKDIASLQVNAPGVDGNPGIEFAQMKWNDQGTVLQVQMNVKPTAREGVNTITIRNTKGESQNFNLNVTINGNQYLNRRFANTTIKFYGLWKDVAWVMPWVDDVQAGWEFMNHGAYKKLNIDLSIFEQRYWKETAQKKYCDHGNNNSFGIGGCAYKGTPYVYLSERSKDAVLTLKSTIIHEAAHKLHFYYNDFYSGRVAKSLVGGFQSKWKNAVGDLSNCKYLPLSNGKWINEKDEYIPRCGFAMAYGASQLTLFPEDVASFTETIVTKPETMKKGDWPTDSRYKQKENILKQYEFIP